MQFNADYLYYPVGQVGPVTQLKWTNAIQLGRNNQFRTTLERQNTYKELMLSFLHYL